MKVFEVKDIARKWVHEVGSQEPGFLGAFFAGSINWMPEDAPWSPLSDVDIFMLVDREIADWSEQKKFLHKGVVLEAVIFPVDRFRSPEQVLSRIDAINLSIPSIISDPSGHLTELQRAVAEGYAQRKWVRKRCEQARDNILSEYLEMMICSESLTEQVLNLIWALMETAQIPALAHLRNPTVRKCLVVSRELLAEQGKLSLHESLLRLLGSAEMKREQVELHLQECTRAFDRAVELIRTPFWGDFDVNNQMRPIAIDGGWELIRSGYPREAIFWVLLIHNLAQTVIQNDAPEEERAQFMRRYKRILRDLGLSSRDDFRRRAELVKGILKDVMEVAEEIIASNPAIEH
jgi:hypothetical protein